MTREQKALAAYGSVLVVGVFLFLVWSRLGGLVLFLLGAAAVTAVLRLTHPMGSHLRTRLGLPAPAPRQPAAARTQEEQRVLRQELQRRREQATARTLGEDPRAQRPGR